MMKQTMQIAAMMEVTAVGLVLTLIFVHNVNVLVRLLVMEFLIVSMTMGSVK